MPKGTRADPFLLDVGGVDRFYAIFGGANGFLDPGDTLSTAPFTAPDSGVTLALPEINSAPLTLDGVEYAADTVASVQVSAIALDDLVRIVCTATTVAARTRVEEMWLRGV